MLIHQIADLKLMQLKNKLKTRLHLSLEILVIIIKVQKLILLKQLFNIIKNLIIY